MTPEQEEQVRRALAAVAGRDVDVPPGSPSRPDPPTPPDVTARLDQVLEELVAARRSGSGEAPGAAPPDGTTPAADLGSDRPGSRTRRGAADSAASDSGTPVTRLSSVRADRRARRRAKLGDLLVAAASISVIGVAGGLVANGGFDGLGGVTGGSATSTQAEAASGGGDSAGRGSAPEDLATDGAASPVSLGRDTLRRDVERLLAQGSAPTGPASGCVRPPAPARAATYAVLLDGQPASLVLRASGDGPSTARVYSCAAADPLARASVRAP